MAILNITLPEGANICNGKQVTFRAPCNSTGVTGIKIGDVTYDLLNTEGKEASFIQDTLVSVLIDTDQNKAFIQSSPGGVDVVELTYAEYQALETKDPDTMYLVTDKSVIPGGETYVSKDQLGVSVATLVDGKVSLEQLPVMSNPNLLDNWYFGNPVDQRVGYVVPPDTPYYANDTGALVGTTDKYYTVTSKVSDKAYFSKDGAVYNVPISAAIRGYTGVGYGIDRWALIGDTASVIINNDSITLNGGTSGAWWNQYLDNQDKYIGRTVTFSVLYTGNNLNAITGVLTSDGTLNLTSSPNGWDSVGIENGKLRMQISCNANLSKSPIAAKLELGTEQTLAHQDADGNWVLNEIPDYGEQLLRCCMSKADSSDTYANNKMTPAAINAVNKAGDTMTGALKSTKYARYSGGSVTNGGGYAALDAINDNNEIARFAVIKDNSGNSNWIIQNFNSSGAYIGGDTVLHTGNKDLIFTYGTEDLTAGTSTLETGKLYFVYE